MAILKEDATGTGMEILAAIMNIIIGIIGIGIPVVLTPYLWKVIF